MVAATLATIDCRPKEETMRLIAELLILAALRRFWRRRLTDQYALLIADIGLTRAEQDVLLTLRQHRG